MRRKQERWVEKDFGYTTPCHFWLLRKNPDGYGRERAFNADGKNYVGYAHIEAWKRAHGDVPEGMEIDHLCGTKSCVNPEHLEAVTPRENSRRAKSTKLTPNDVRQIRRATRPRKELAAVFAVSPRHIDAILAGRVWADVV